MQWRQAGLRFVPRVRTRGKGLCFIDTYIDHVFIFVNSALGDQRAPKDPAQNSMLKR
jgi:hypothetical protein